VKRILNVNDQPALRKIATRILTEEGYRVMEASSGAEALAVTRTQHPDLLLLDVRMEGMSGFEVCSEIRKDPATSAIPIIILSGHHLSLEDISLGRSLGANAYLTLPLDKARLLETVRGLM